MATLDVFRIDGRRRGARLRAARAGRERGARASPGGSSARRSARCSSRKSAMASMATDVDASALLVYRAAWTKDGGAARVTRESAMAKWFATEAAGRVCDRAVQLFGGRGVDARRDRRAALPRRARAAHLRRRERNPAGGDRQGRYSSHERSRERPHRHASPRNGCRRRDEMPEVLRRPSCTMPSGSTSPSSCCDGNGAEGDRRCIVGAGGDEWTYARAALGSNAHRARARRRPRPRARQSRVAARAQHADARGLLVRRAARREASW